MEAYQLQLQEVVETPVRGGGAPPSGAPKGNYMEVRREEPIPASQLCDPDQERGGGSGGGGGGLGGVEVVDRDESDAAGGGPQGSVAEISTIAKEVDKVNQIITNCIDALKSESTSFQAAPPPGLVSMATGGDPQLVMSAAAGSERRCSPSSHGGRGGVFLSPAYKGRSPASRPALQRHHSVEAPPLKRGSASSAGSLRSPRSLRSVATVTPAAVILRAAEAERLHADHHRHSYPGPAHSPPLRAAPLPIDPTHQRGRPPILEPLSLPRQPRELAYSQLSPDDYPDYQEVCVCACLCVSYLMTMCVF